MTQMLLIMILLANVNDGSCIDFVYGCIDSEAFNYNLEANVDDGSCIPIINGCMDPAYMEYDSQANTDPGLCDSINYYGCMDIVASNFQFDASIDDGSCYYNGCMDTLLLILSLMQLWTMALVCILLNVVYLNNIMVIQETT